MKTVCRVLGVARSHVATTEADMGLKVNIGVRPEDLRICPCCRGGRLIEANQRFYHWFALPQQ